MATIPPNHQNDKTWHKATFRLSRTSGTMGEHMSFHLTDKLTGIALLDVEMSLEDLMRAITGYAGLPARYQIRGAEYVGKLEEYKSFREPVHLPEHNQRAKVAFDAAQKHCIDGWMYAGPSPGGHDSWTQNDWQSYDNPMGKGPKLTNHTVLLRFVRYVEPATIQGQLQPATPVKRVRVRRPDQQ